MITLKKIVYDDLEPEDDLDYDVIIESDLLDPQNYRACVSFYKDRTNELYYFYATTDDNRPDKMGQMNDILEMIELVNEVSKLKDEEAVNRYIALYNATFKLQPQQV